MHIRIYAIGMKNRMLESRMGRPPLPKGVGKTEQVVFRVEPSLCEEMRAAAKREGKGLATWIRETVAERLRSQ